MPFFEMMSRFQQILRKENTVLLVIGYSFGDAHVNRVILEALNSNLNFEVVVVSPTVNLLDDKTNDTLKRLHQLVDNGNTSVTLISDTFQRFVQQMPKVVYTERNDIAQQDKTDDVRITEDEEPVPF